MNTYRGDELELRAGDIFANRYHIRKSMGTGSLSSAFRCRDASRDNAECVLKVLGRRHYQRAGFVNAFTMMTKSATSLMDPHICRVIDVGRHQGDLYYVSEFVPGITFRLWLLKTLTFEERIFNGISSLKHLLAAMGFLHTRGFYANIKPENIFLNGERLVLSDYWVPAFLPPAEFETNPPARQYLPYIAPEVMDDWCYLSPASDLYSAGAILYEILIGKPPIGQYKKPSFCSQYYTGEVDRITARAIEKKPSDRYGTCEEFSASLDRLLSILRPDAADPVEVAEPSQHRESEVVQDDDSETAFISLGLSPHSHRKSGGPAFQEDHVLRSADRAGEYVFDGPQPDAEFEEEAPTPDTEEASASLENLYPPNNGPLPFFSEEQEDPEESEPMQGRSPSPEPRYNARFGERTTEAWSEDETVAIDPAALGLDEDVLAGAYFNKSNPTAEDDGSDIQNADSASDFEFGSEQPVPPESAPLTDDDNSLASSVSPSAPPAPFSESAIPRVHEETAEIPIFSSEEPDVEDIIPDPEVDKAAKKALEEMRSGEVRSHNTGHIPQVGGRTANWSEDDDSTPIPVWVKILLILLGLVLASSGVMIGVFYPQLMRLF